MADSSLPDSRPPDPAAPVRPRALVLPAVAEPPLDERGPWLERYEFADALAVPGHETPLYLTADGIAVATTGIGKSDAATTVAALCASPGVGLESTYVVSAGIAGSAPERAALGSVVVADAVVDWDRKHRWDRGGEEPTKFSEAETTDSPDAEPAGSTDAEPADSPNTEPPLDSPDADPPIDLLAYRPRDYVHHLNETLVTVALESIEEVELATDDAVREYQRRYPDATDDGPVIDVGTTVCGDEFWHGPRYAREVDWLCAAYGVGPYATTQMEDAATATALGRFGHLDRYLSVRAVANYDRPAPGESVEESFDGVPESLELGIGNAARVGSTVVEHLVETDPLDVR